MFKQSKNNFIRPTSCKSYTFWAPLPEFSTKQDETFMMWWDNLEVHNPAIYSSLDLHLPSLHKYIISKTIQKYNFYFDNYVAKIQ